MSKEYYTENLSDETLVKLLDEMIRFEKNQKTNSIKPHLLKAIPAVAAIVLIIGAVNILPAYLTDRNADINPLSAGINSIEETEQDSDNIEETTELYNKVFIYTINGSGKILMEDNADSEYSEYAKSLYTVIGEFPHKGGMVYFAYRNNLTAEDIVDGEALSASLKEYFDDLEEDVAEYSDKRMCDFSFNGGVVYIIYQNNYISDDDIEELRAMLSHMNIYTEPSNKEMTQE